MFKLVYPEKRKNEKVHEIPGLNYAMRVIKKKNIKNLIDFRTWDLSVKFNRRQTWLQVD